MASIELKKEEGIIIPIIKEVDMKPADTNNKLVKNNVKATAINIKPFENKIKPYQKKPLFINANQNNIKSGSASVLLSPLSTKSIGSPLANKKSVKILPKPAAIGFSIGNIVTNLSAQAGHGGASTYFIVTSLPTAPVPSTIPNNIQVSVNNDPLTSVKRKERYECSDCDSSFQYKASLVEHVRQEHKRKDTFQCEFCDKEFRRKHLLQSHVKSRHNEINLQKCSKCDEEFQSAKLLNSHLEKEHKEKYYTCPECGLEFNLRNTLMNHIKSVHRKEKSFQCDQCDARYSWKKSLNLHIDATHKNLAQYKCSQCTSIFRWKTSLVHHLKAAHKTEEVSKHPCADCTLSFNSERRLNLHRKKIHKDKFAVLRMRKGRGRFINRNKTEENDSGSDSESSEDDIPPHIDRMEIVDPSEKYTLPDVSINNGSPVHNNVPNDSNLNDFNLPLPSHTNNLPIQPTMHNNFNPSTPFNSYNPYFAWK